MFLIYSEFSKGEVTVLFTSKALLENVIKQSEKQPSFLHLDGTYKLIDLGLPLLIVSTENLQHNFRPIAFCVSWAESTQQVTLMLEKIRDFLYEHFNFRLRPKYILTDNSDALITGCRKAVDHDYVHLGCHFHIGKRVREKAMSKDLKDKKKCLFFGVKILKNSPTLEFFQRAWAIIKKYWEDNEVNAEFIKTFESEYRGSA